MRGLEDVAKKLGFEPPKKPKRESQGMQSGILQTVDSAAERVPMMYRAQVGGRCSLQYGKNNKDLERWTTEWVNPDENRNNQPRVQRETPALGLDGNVYRMKMKFPWRVFTNGGEDSILRPALGKDGIPIIPGSGVKGLFERLARTHPKEETQREIRRYCGDAESQGLLRFHGAYPVGNWAGTHQVRTQRYGQTQIETRHRMVDVVHPQQDRQVKEQGRPQAIAVVSFYQPELIFELSAQPKLSLDEAGWERVEGLLKRALRSGLGGKTSSGYGLCLLPQDRYAVNLKLRGTGVSSLLRSDEPEFRPNLFKATLRGHASRLLSGVCGDERVVKQAVDKLFGGPSGPGSVKLYWDMPEPPRFKTQGQEETPIYQATGTLRLDAEKADLPFCQQLLAFAFVMGGWGKSWRRTWHKGPGGWHPGFMSSYESRAIGCHWEWLDSEGIETPNIQTPDDLQDFLNQGQAIAQRYLNQSGHANWKETWHPSRLAVYAVRTPHSRAIQLFHDAEFKTTLAIGGRKPDDDRPTAFSSVWHRMLPVDEGYLEIVTTFNSDRQPWQREGLDQLPKFIGLLKENGFGQVYGSSVISKGS